jgi:hypothetical protein
MSEWKDITTAPTDQRVLVCSAKRLTYAVARYTDKDGWEVETCSDWIPIYPPRFWMPLPPLPVIPAENRPAAHE